MRLFSYIVTHDTGFAPNPFWGYCTVATCKPVIRKVAEVGDWVVGISPKEQGNKLIYVMEVNEKMPIEDYFNDPRFEKKKPNMNSDKIVDRTGDNIYKPLGNGSFIQLHSLHSKKDGSEDLAQKEHDLNGKFVLVSKNFVYYGAEAIDLPENLRELIVGRGHKSNFSKEIINNFHKFVQSLPRGIQGRPYKWNEGDDSWRGAI